MEKDYHIQGVTAPTTETSEPTFKPFKIFFYGSLMLPEVLRRTIGLPDDEEIVYRPASTRMYKLKKWGPFPALIPEHETRTPIREFRVKGVVYEVREEAHLQRLRYYETSNYELRDVLGVYHLPDGKETFMQGKTFVWCGDMEALEEGAFDMEEYRQAFCCADAIVTDSPSD